MTALDTSTADAVREAGQRYTAAGIHVLPINVGTKSPDPRVLDGGRWKPYQTRLPYEHELTAWFSLGGHEIGIVTGTEHNLLGIDIDVAEFKPFFMALLQQKAATVAAKLKKATIVRTPSGGEHWYVRSEKTVAGNQQLAYHLTDIPDGAEWETKRSGAESVKFGGKEYPVIEGHDGSKRAKTIAIETRGEGGYAKTFPSLGYTLIQGDLTQLPVLTAEEVETLYTIARILDACPEKRNTQGRSPQSNSTGSAEIPIEPPARGTGRPGDDFNAYGNPLPLLLDAGWSVDGHLGDVTYLCRPGKTDGVSASFGHCGDRNLYVFSSNAHPFAAGQCYSPFAIIAVLKHSGDYKAAAAALRQEGWGEQEEAKSARTNSPTDEQIDAVCATYSHTDLGNAERFATRWAAKLRWIDNERTWVTWTGKYWERQETATIALKASAIVARCIQDEAKHILEDDFKTKLQKHGRLSESRGAISATTECSKLHDNIRAKSSDFDREQLLLSLDNGTLDLASAQRNLREHDPHDLLTTHIPVAYDPAANAPVWDKFLLDVLPDPDVRHYIKKWLGYSLTGETSDQTFLFFYGTGANGKGTFVDTLVAIFAGLHERVSEAVITTGDADTGVSRFGLAGIQGKRLVTFGELEAGKRLNESLLKSLTGQDPVYIERKNVQGYSITPIAKYILIGNHKPSVRGDDNGIWRRVRLIPFTTSFPLEKRDTGLRQKLLHELPGILNWLLAGYDAYRAEGLIPPAAVVAATDEYRSDSDTFGQFLDDRCEVVAGKQSAGSDLYSAYTDWCTANGQRFPLTNKSFAAKLKDRGFETKKTKTSNVWIGIRVLSPSEREKREANDWYVDEEGSTSRETELRQISLEYITSQTGGDADDLLEW